jgi:hypothetical protein
MPSNFTSPVMVDGMDIISGQSIPGAAERHVITRSTTTDATWLYYSTNMSPEYHHTSPATALAACTSGRNDVCQLSPDSHSLAATLAWNKNMTHLVGMYGPARQNMRSRMGMSAAFSPMMTVSGYGNTLQSLYFMHGTTSATNLNCLTDTGGRNSYINCHFLGQDATAMDEAGYNLVYLDNNEIFFQNCQFGGDGAAMSHGALVKFGDNVDPPRSVFENCTFLMCADNAAPVFLKAEAGVGNCWIIFKGCTFLNSGTQLTYGIDGTGLGNADMYFDNNCCFHDVADITATGKDAYVHMPIGCTVAAILTNLHATYPDHS